MKKINEQVMIIFIYCKVDDDIQSFLYVSKEALSVRNFK